MKYSKYIFLSLILFFAVSTSMAQRTDCTRQITDALRSKNPTKELEKISSCPDCGCSESHKELIRYIISQRKKSAASGKSAEQAKQLQSEVAYLQSENDDLRTEVYLLRKTVNKMKSADKQTQVMIDSLENHYVEIDNPEFSERLLKMYDSNGDDKLSLWEAADIKQLDLTKKYFWEKGVHDLSCLQYFPNLVSLNCSNNAISAIDLTKCVKLKKLVLNNCQLQIKGVQLDLSKNTELEVLECKGNKLRSLDLTSCKKMKKLICPNNELHSIDLSNNKELLTLDCSYNQLKSLNLTNNKKLQSLICKSNIIGCDDGVIAYNYVLNLENCIYISTVDTRQNVCLHLIKLPKGKKSELGSAVKKSGQTIVQ